MTWSDNHKCAERWFVHLMTHCLTDKLWFRKCTSKGFDWYPFFPVWWPVWFTGSFKRFVKKQELLQLDQVEDIFDVILLHLRRIRTELQAWINGFDTKHYQGIILFFLEWNNFQGATHPSSLRSCLTVRRVFCGFLIQNKNLPGKLFGNPKSSYRWVWEWLFFFVPFTFMWPCDGLATYPGCACHLNSDCWIWAPAPCDQDRRSGWKNGWTEAIFCSCLVLNSHKVLITRWSLHKLMQKEHKCGWSYSLPLYSEFRVKHGR